MASELEQTRALLNRALGALEAFSTDSGYVAKLADDIRKFMEKRYTTKKGSKQ